MKTSSIRGTPTRHVDPSGAPTEAPYAPGPAPPEESSHVVSRERYGVVIDTTGVDMNAPEVE